jgi:hypothetical protein
MDRDHDAAAAKTLELLLELKGEFVWFVRLSADNVLRMEFGSSHLKITEPYPHVAGSSQTVVDALERRIVTPRGKWHLFIAEGEWCVTTKFYSCSRSDADAEKIGMALRQLDGQRLVDVRQSNGYHDWILEFDLGGFLHLKSPDSLEESQSKEDVQWTLFYQDGNYVSYTTGGGLSHKEK